MKKGDFFYYCCWMDCFFVVVLSGISFIFLPRKVCRMGPKKAIIHLWAVGNLCSPIYINLCKYWNTAELKAYISWFVNATHTNTHGWNNKKILWCDMRRINPVKCRTCCSFMTMKFSFFHCSFFFKCNEFSRRSIFVDKQISATRNQRKNQKGPENAQPEKENGGFEWRLQCHCNHTNDSRQRI